MSCVVAIKADGFVYLASESQSTRDGERYPDGTKLLSLGKIVVGMCGNNRLGSWIDGHREKLSVLDPEGLRPSQFVEEHFVPILKAFALEQRSFHKRLRIGRKHVATALNWQLLLAFGSDVCWLNVMLDPYWSNNTDVTAIGSGAHYAYGSLHETEHMTVDWRLERALMAACKYDTACGGPFQYVSTDDKWNVRNGLRYSIQ